MVRRTLFALFAAVLSVASLASYRFQVVENTSVVTIHPDASVTVEYTLVFLNQGQPIDIVDVGLPGPGYRDVVADLGGTPMTDIRPSEYVEHGVEVHLGAASIPAGVRGTLHLRATVPDRVFPDDQDPAYASVVFIPTWYGAEFTSGTTALSCSFVFPEGMTTEEPRYHGNQPSGAGVRDDGRIVYTWENPSASPSGQYTFGASLPRRVMTTVVERPAPSSGGGVEWSPVDTVVERIFGCFPCFFFLVVPGTIIFGIYKNQKRKLQYLPASVGMEGVEVRRGLTVPEVAVLMEEKVDRVMALVLFGLIRKEALAVTGRSPLRLEVKDAAKAQFSYETEFIKAVQDDGKVSEAEGAKVMTDLVKKVGEKMKGYSRKRSLEFYRDIMARAWEQVGSEDYSQAFEWILLDSKLDKTVQERFGPRPIPVPYWWTTISGPHRNSEWGHLPAPGTGGRLPNLTTTADKIVSGFEGFGRDLVNSVPGLAGKVTTATNPMPVARGGGCAGGGCACACACAGCACACAGGGR